MRISTKFLIVALASGALAVSGFLSDTLNGIAHAIAGSFFCLFLITFIFHGAFQSYDESGENTAGPSH
jgi:hypothetical protein